MLVKENYGRVAAGQAIQPPFSALWKPPVKNPHMLTFDSQLVGGLLKRGKPASVATTTDAGAMVRQSAQA